MKILIAVPPEKFREEELFIPAKIFQDRKTNFDLASTHVGFVMGILGKQAKVNRTFEDLLIKGSDEYYALVIIGGPGTQIHLWNNRHLHELIRIFSKKGKVIAGIDNAPLVIAKAGILKKKEATVTPGPLIREMMIEDVIIVNKPVFFKDKVVTAQGVNTAEEFATVILKYQTEDPEFVGTKSKAGFEF